MPVILLIFQLKFNFLDSFFENTQISDLVKILPVGAELLHADGQIDMPKVIVAFRNFARASKICLACSEMKILNTVLVTLNFYFRS